MGRRVGFESWVERDQLVVLDFDPAVTAVASQPFWLLWRAGGKASGHHLLARDSWLNAQALARLEALSAISRSRLVRALPALRQEAPSPQFPELPGDRPALRCYVPDPRPWLACRACTLRVPRFHADGHGQAPGLPAGLPPPPALARNRRRAR
jgi:hypothetical protein